MNSSQNAIAVLYRKYWQKLYIHAYNLLNDGESAKDVLSGNHSIFRLDISC